MRPSITLERFTQLAMPIVLAAFIVLALANSVIIPLGEASDEVSHFAYIQYLREHQRLPLAEGAVLGEAHQPPLYYLIGAVSTLWIPPDNFQVIANPDYALDEPQAPNVLLHTRREAFPYQNDVLVWHLARLLSVAMGAVTVWATYQITTLLFPGERWLGLSAAAFVAFLPEFTFISSVVNNDNLVVMLSSLSILQTLRMLKRQWNILDATLLGLLLGLALLTKLSGVVLWPFAALVFFQRALKSGEWKKVTLHTAICFGIAGIVVAPWLLYNLASYGDPIGWSLMLSVAALRQAPLTLNDAPQLLQGLYTSFWGRFGGPVQIEMAGVIYAALGGVAVLALIGWLGYVRRAREHTLDTNIRALLIAFVVFWVLLIVTYVRWAVIDLGADQARKLFPGLTLLAIFLMVGLARLFAARSKNLIIIFPAALFALTLAVTFYLNDVYASPHDRLVASIAPKVIPPSADFGPTIRVLDYKIETRQVAPGQRLGVQIEWQALQNPREDYWLLLQLANQNGAVANQDGVPANGRLTTDWWQPGQRLTSHHRLVVPTDLAPGTYALRLGLHPFGRWEWLPVRGQEMLTLDTIVVTAAQ